MEKYYHNFLPEGFVRCPKRIEISIKGGFIYVIRIFKDIYDLNKNKFQIFP